MKREAIEHTRRYCKIHADVLCNVQKLVDKDGKEKNIWKKPLC